MFDRHFAHWPPGVPRTLELPRESVYANLAASAARASRARGDRLLRRRRSPTRELKREADALAGFLQQRCGVAKGDRVLLYLQNCPQFVIALLRDPARRRGGGAGEPDESHRRAAPLRRGFPGARRHRRPGRAARGSQPLGARSTSSSRRTPITCARPTDLPLPDFRARAAPATRRMRMDAMRIAPGLHAGRTHRAGRDDLAVMPYTSGTTGKPKGCMHTHSSVQATTVPYLYWRGARRRRWCSARCRCSTSPACRPE